MSAASLLAAAMQDGRQTEFPTRHQGADPIRSAELVCGEAQHVESGCREVDVDVTDSLDRITVGDRAVLGGSRGDLAYWLQCAYLVVSPHDRNQRGSRIESLAERRKISPTSRIDGDVADLS